MHHLSFFLSKLGVFKYVFQFLHVRWVKLFGKHVTLKQSLKNEKNDYPSGSTENKFHKWHTTLIVPYNPPTHISFIPPDTPAPTPTPTSHSNCLGYIQMLLG